MKYIAYTDGSSRGNPGSAGWGTIVMTEDRVREYSGHYSNATNNQMEIMGALGALKFATQNLGIIKDSEDEIIIHSDSKYVVDGATSWIHNWVRNNWKTSTKKEVLNKDLWIEVWGTLSLLKERGVAVSMAHVRGHNGNIYNERADKICTNAALSLGGDLYQGSREEYEKFISLD